MSSSTKRALGMGLVMAATVFAAALPGVSACADKKSGIMLAITTDMKAPKDVNAVSVTVKTNDAIKHNVVGRVTPQGDILLPATIAIVQPDDPNASIKIRVMAFQDRRARVLRDVRTSIPAGGRVALLRIPLNFVNEGSVTGEVAEGVIPAPNPGTGGTSTSSSGGSSSGSSGTSGGPAVDGGSGPDAGTSSSSTSSSGSVGPIRPAEDPTEFVPNCENPEHTWIDGECKDAYIDPNTLPDFEEGLVGAQEPGKCFDPKVCFANAIAVAQGEGGSSGSGQSNPGGGDGAGAGRDASASAAPPPVDAGMGGKDLWIRAVTLDRGSCAVNLNGANAARLNLAIVTPDTGECIRPGQCFVPLDKGGSGWKEENGRVQLPRFVCKLLEKPGLQLYAATDTCSAKEESNPICIEQNVSPRPIDPIADGGTNAGATFVVSEDRPTDVVVAGSDIYVAGASRLARVPLFGQPVGQAVPNVPGLAAPWRLSRIEPINGIAATNGTATGYHLTGGSESTVTAVSLGAAPGNGVAVAGGSFYWAVGANGTGGIYTSLPGETNATKLGNPANLAATAIASVNEAIVVGDEAGNLTACIFEGGTPSCIAPTKAVDGRIDAISNAGSFGYALAPKGVFRITGNSSEGYSAQSVLATDATGVTIDGKYHPRSFAHAANCVFATSSAGVEWGRVEGGAKGVLATVPAGRHAFGVALGPAVGGANGRAVVYWTLYAPLDQGGGLYYSELPVQCSGTGGTVTPDAGATVDAGTPPMCRPPGADCQGPDQCCSLQCNVSKCQ